MYNPISNKLTAAAYQKDVSYDRILPLPSLPEKFGRKLRRFSGRLLKVSKCPGALPRVLLTRSADLLVEASPFGTVFHRTLALVTRIRPSGGRREVISLLVDAVDVVLGFNGDTRTPNHLTVLGGTLCTL